MPRTQQRILIIDNRASSNLAVYLLKRAGFEVKTASSIADAVKLSHVEHFDLQLLNHELVDGLEVDSCDRLHKFAPRAPILFYSTVLYPYEPYQPIRCRQHGHSLMPVYAYDIVGHALRLTHNRTEPAKSIQRSPKVDRVQELQPAAVTLRHAQSR